MLEQLQTRMAQLGLLTMPLSARDHELGRVRYGIEVAEGDLFEYAIYLGDYQTITDEDIQSHQLDSKQLIAGTLAA